MFMNFNFVDFLSKLQFSEIGLTCEETLILMCRTNNFAKKKFFTDFDIEQNIHEF